MVPYDIERERAEREYQYQLQRRHAMMGPFARHYMGGLIDPYGVNSLPISDDLKTKEEVIKKELILLL